jgi:long-chain acyl-CoA synthetase
MMWSKDDKGYHQTYNEYGGDYLMIRPWLNSYSAGTPAEIAPDRYSSLVDMLDQACAKHASAIACTAMGANITYAQLSAWGDACGAWLQQRGVQPKARVALMMPNVPAYLVGLLGTLRAGCVVVNVNPLYTSDELARVLKDSGAEAIIILENFAHTLTAVKDRAALKHIVVTGAGDLLGGLKTWTVNLGVRYLKRMIPPWSLPGALRLSQILCLGRDVPLRRCVIPAGELAILQYTGGTTGTPKGALLSHRNVIANVLQLEAMARPALQGAPEQLVVISALPLYHIFALTLCGFYGIYSGMRNLMIINPRDLPTLIKAWKRLPVNVFPAVNTLFNALVHHPDFAKLDFRGLRLSLGGGMAVQRKVAEDWMKLTGRPLIEGYGLSETSPLATANPTDATEYSGAIGVPVPSTDVAILNDAGMALKLGEHGEIGIRGPQVMQGYWHNEAETAAAMTADGFFRSGDIGVMDERGYVWLVDRKKDMILVSGFNVYPNEVEDAMVSHPGILECAAVGVPDDHSGEVVKVFVVKKNQTLTELDVLDWGKTHLTGYKRPRYVEFRTELPKSNVGKILRRQLR